ncbi:MAG TPA: 30S ribosomal protein S20 [Anaerolineae bacterium]|nr:30S ribosomal protein S20 [Anaerolineae bacterium]
MAKTASAKKRIRSSAKRRERNRMFRSRARTFIKKARKLIAEGRIEEAKEAVRLAVSALDKAAEKGIIHKNAAARRKSRLMRMLNRAMAQ